MIKFHDVKIHLLEVNNTVANIHETLNFITITTKTEHSCLIAYSGFSFPYVVVICVCTQVIFIDWNFDRFLPKEFGTPIMIF